MGKTHLLCRYGARSALALVWSVFTSFGGAEWISGIVAGRDGGDVFSEPRSLQDSLSALAPLWDPWWQLTGAAIVLAAVVGNVACWELDDEPAQLLSGLPGLVGLICVMWQLGDTKATMPMWFDGMIAAGLAGWLIGAVTLFLATLRGTWRING